MPYFFVPVPPHISQYLQSLPCPGMRETSDHITLLYMGRKVDPKLRGAYERVGAVASMFHAPFEVELSDHRTSFSSIGNPRGTPLIVRTYQENLGDLNGTLKELCSLVLLPFDTKYPTFTPHVTMSFADPTKEPYLDEPIMTDGGYLEWRVTEIGLKWDDEGPPMMFALKK